MKLLLTLYLVLYLLPAYTQQSGKRVQINTVSTLVAKNNKHTRRFENDDILKIYYRDSGRILKGKGRLFISSNDRLQLVPYGRKRAITININDIAAIGLWRRGDKIAAAMIGGTLITLALLADRGSSTGFGLVILAGITGLYEVIAIPTFLLTEELSIRSEKKGYHFFIENTKLENTIHKGHHFIRW